MSDELNQVTEENVFSDVTEEENLFEDVEETPETPETEEVQEEPKSFLKVKYNGEEQDLNEEDARTFAQKGMNYDKIYNPLEKLAKANGMQVGEYLNQLEATQRQYEVSKEVDRLRQDEKYADLSDEILEEIANSRIDQIITQEAQNEAEAINQDQLQVQREVDMFLKEYPEFQNKGPDSLDPKVYDYVKQGYTLLEAYNKFSRENPKEKAQRQNEENKKRSLGNTTNAGTGSSDDFLSGFLNG